ncbi:MAG: radical SAM protein [Rhodothermales bacterium]
MTEVPSGTLSTAEKFVDPDWTAGGDRRARVELDTLATLWFNTGTLCNLSCTNCYIESTPTNDRLVYLSLDDVLVYLDEIEREGLGTKEIGLTGGEPFMNPEILPIMDACLSRGFELLVLTNAMRPMMRHSEELLRLKHRFGDSLTLRVSVDHFTRELHEDERGAKTWEPMMVGLKWLAENGFRFDIAARTRWGDSEHELREGFGALFDRIGVSFDATDRKRLVLFPEMDPHAEVPEITTACWGILGVDPTDIMCASSRMVVRHKGADRPSVQACTLLAYDPRFNMGETLLDASKEVALNHRFCATFCVLGGGSCSI